MHRTATIWQTQPQQQQKSQGYYEEEPPEGGPGPLQPQEHAVVRENKRLAREAIERAEKAERTAAFLRAGIDPDQQGIGAYFVKAYDGDLTPEKIKEAALAAGIIQPPPPDPEAAAQEQADANNLSAQQRVSAAATAGQSGAPDPDTHNRSALQAAFEANGVDGLTQVLAASGIPIAEN